MNYRGIISIYNFEMSRALRTIGQTIASPVISTVLYFIVFGAAIGDRMGNVSGVQYGAFIVPGLTMLTILSQGVSNASFGIYFPRFAGTIYEVFSAPLSFIEITVAYVGAAATKSFIIGIIVLCTASLFIPLKIKHPCWMLFFLTMISITFSLLGFIIGICVDGFDKLQMVPLLVITPLTFLGGSFYSINMLPAFWQKISFFNPIVYLVSGFRWSFYEISDVNHIISAIMIICFTMLFTVIILWIFKTGYGIKK